MKEYRLKIVIAQRTLSDRHAEHAACVACLAERVGPLSTVGKLFE